MRDMLQRYLLSLRSTFSTPITLNGECSPSFRRKYNCSSLFVDSICKSTYSLEFIGTPKLNIHRTFVVIQGYTQSCKKLKSPSCTFPAEAEQDYTLPTCFNPRTVNMCFFLVNFMPYFSQFSAFCRRFCLFNKK